MSLHSSKSSSDLDKSSSAVAPEPSAILLRGSTARSNASPTKFKALFRSKTCATVSAIHTQVRVSPTVQSGICPASTSVFSTLEVVKVSSQFVTRVKLDIYTMTVAMDGGNRAVNTWATMNSSLTTYHFIHCWVAFNPDWDWNLVLNDGLLFVW